MRGGRVRVRGSGSGGSEQGQLSLLFGCLAAVGLLHMFFLILIKGTGSRVKAARSASLKESFCTLWGGRIQTNTGKHESSLERAMRSRRCYIFIIRTTYLRAQKKVFPQNLLLS